MNNDIISFILGAAVSAIVFGLVLWIFLKTAKEKARAEVETEKAVLGERLLSRERQLQAAEQEIAPLREGNNVLQGQLQAEAERRAAAEEKNTRIPEMEEELAAISETLKACQDALQAESARCATAEEKNSRIPELESELQTKVGELEALQAKMTSTLTEQAELKITIEKERKAAEEKLELLNEAQQKLGDAFKALSSEALQNNNQSFLDLAKSALQTYQESAKGDLEKRQQAITELLKPISESLVKVDGKIAEIEKERTVAYTSLTEQVKAMATTQLQLQAETSNLVKALRAPQVRGRWGEIQLQRVVEMAGMVEYCDFQQQESVTTEEGRLRPDLVVKLPGGKNVVVDAKCPLQAYLDALAATDETLRKTHLMRHAEQVNAHITLLGRKNYWDQFHPTPEFVVLFLPGETFFSAALEQRPELIEAGAEQKVILATPTTLIALLKAVAYGWKQERIAENAQEISDLGKRVYEGVRVFTEHLSKLGSSLGTVVGHYNSAVGSLERSFLPSARKFNELGSGSDKLIEDLDPIDKSPRDFKAPELLETTSTEELSTTTNET
jgi:DNA recombination protein RmuC